MPLLVRLLAGNPATSAGVLACLNTADARHLRQLYPAVGAVVAAVPWCDTETRVVDPVRWRAGLPAAVGETLAGRAVESLLASELAVAALSGITRLDVRKCPFVTDKLLPRLPASLRTLNLRSCHKLTSRASLAHLTALTTLEWTWTGFANERTDGLPSSLRELDANGVHLALHGVSLAHLTQLRVLRANGSGLNDVTLASLPPSLEELYAAHGRGLTPAASFSHLTALRKLDSSHSTIGDASLATLPLSLVFLDACKCKKLTAAAVLPHLPALELLDVSDTHIGDALVASLPASLTELRLACCRSVTASAMLDHLRALRVLHCIGVSCAGRVPRAWMCRASGQRVARAQSTCWLSRGVGRWSAGES